MVQLNAWHCICECVCIYMYTISGHISNACPPNPMANLKNYNVIFAQPARNQLWLTLGGFFAQSQVSISCVYVCVSVSTVLQDTPPQFVSPSVLLAAQCTAAGGGCVQAESPKETTTHIKGVPLVEHDYQPLSYESRVLPPPKHHSLARGGKGEERMIC